ncbi:glycosyltransferase [Polaribacter sp.]|uniref:glycosyltransferase n=1 Tax=Polaribacter sp. TaxID=1920175 RepID=UPI003F6C5DA1
MKKLIMIHTVTPDYRAVFYKGIQDSLKDRFKLYSGELYFEPTIVSDKKIEKERVKNIFLFHRKFLFQKGIWHLLFKNDVIVLELNPRIISNWIFLLVRYFLNKETYSWGHAWGRKGINNKTDFLRNFMRNLSDGVIVYTSKQKSELQDKMPQKKVFAAPNSLFSCSKMVLSEDSNIRKNIISVCRLIPSKKIVFLVESFIRGIEKLPKETNLIIVGDGDEKEKIKKIINNHNVGNRIKLLGHISDYNQLKELYSKAYFSVSSGYVGLSVTQSFGFGVPMLISKEENHSPEIEAAIAGKNAVFFKTDCGDDFIKKTIQVFAEKDYWNKERKNIVEFCKKNYSSEAMAKVFIELV